MAQTLRIVASCITVKAVMPERFIWSCRWLTRPPPCASRKPPAAAGLGPAQLLGGSATAIRRATWIARQNPELAQQRLRAGLREWLPEQQQQGQRAQGAGSTQINPMRRLIFLSKNSCTPIDEPAPTITGGGTHLAEVRAFLIKYYSEGGQDQPCTDPMHTIPTKDRIGLVTVAGEEYQIADIGMRMLEPRELYRAQGFPESYVIDPVVNGRKLPKHAQVRMCGNSVCPPLAAALARANVPEMAAWSPAELKKQKVAA